MRICVLGCIDSMYHDGPRIAASLERQGHHVYMLSLNSPVEHTIEALKSFRPEFCLVTIGRGYDTTALRTMKDSTIMVHWAYDEYTPEKDSLYKDVAGIYDLTLVKAKGIIPLLKDYCNRVEYIPMFYDPINDGLPQKFMKDIPLVFIGEPHPVQSTVRQEYLRKLGEDGYIVTVIGYYWGEFKKDLGRAHFLGGVVGHDAAQIMARTKICLNFENDLLTPVELGFSDRVLKIMGAGSLCLTHEILGIDQLFTEGEHLVTYKDYDDMKHKIEYYLDHPEECRYITYKGQEKVLTDFHIDKVTAMYVKKVEEYRKDR